ncbi:MAG TPA: FecR family protein, partial [Anaerolineales bacterium]
MQTRSFFARSPFAIGVAFLAALALVFPPGAMAQSQQAGQVSRSVTKATIQRGAQRVEASAQTPILWQDVVNTDRGGRARIALDDGSVLNVGSESSLAITKHDASTQQTELDLAYGRVRANVVKLSRPGAEFKVKSRTAVAGVVGT